jgi:PAS domain-containing protein
MHMLAQIVTLIDWSLLWLSHALPTALAYARHLQPMVDNDSLAAIAVSTTVIALLCSGWTAWLHVRLRDFKVADLLASDAEVDYRALADALPIPVWVRGPDLQLRWANATFLRLVGAANCDEAVRTNATLDRSEFDLESAALHGTDIVNAGRYAASAGERRALTINLCRLPDASIAASAIDVTDSVRTEARMQIAADAQSDLLDKLALGIAVFDADQRLIVNNSVYAGMWSFPQDWLDTHPTQDEILDRLRETRLLPERRDFAAWKKENLQLLEERGKHSEAFWHMPSGKSLRVVCEPHLRGGVFFTYEDISESLQLRATVASLAAVYKATLDAIEDPVAIFEPDGCMTQSNQAFSKLWHLTTEELAGGPHFSKIAALCATRFGHDDIWEIVSSAVASQNPERYSEWGNISRPDGRLISLAPVRLPNGSTLITFRDLTDIERFRAFLRESVHHAA